MRQTPRALWPGRILAWLALSLTFTLLLLAFTVAELALLVLSAPGLQRDFGPPLGLALFGLGAFLTLALTVAVHEGGHLLGGRLAGLSPRFAHVGPVTFAKRDGHWRVGWDPRQPLLGGRVVCDLRRAGRARVAVFLAAGPVANLAAFALALALALLPSWPLAQAWAGQLAVLSLAFGAFNLLPFRERLFDSDGFALWRLLAAS
jgi:hypothetical protein